jgi:hypothetical protein
VAMVMKKLIWKIKFSHSTAKIFSKPKGAFKGNYFTHFKLGWKVSTKKYEEYKNNDPWQAALAEISDWYCL